jgi:hypothetical protein
MINRKAFLTFYFYEISNNNKATRGRTVSDLILCPD